MRRPSTHVERTRLITQQNGPVLTVRFNRPPRHFFDEQMSIELDDLTRALRREKSVRSVVFTGTDNTYVTHFDIPTLRGAAAAFPLRVGYQPARIIAAAARLAVTSRRLDALLRRTLARDAVMLGRTYAALDRLSRLDQVVITAVNGLALGMGAIFALACDVRVMADDTYIGMVESGLEFVAGATGTQRLVHAVGSTTAIDLLLDGRLLSAADAERLRLVQHVRPRVELHSTAQEIANRLAERSPSVTREIKRVIYDAGTRPAGAALRREAASAIRTLSTKPAQQSLADYDDYLGAHDPPTDEVILKRWTTPRGATATAPDEGD